MTAAPFRLSDASEDAYRVLGELQVNLRKVLVRAMRRKYGDSWFKNSCPVEVFERLIARKEAELVIDRCATEYQELMFYADFHDMAEIISGCPGVVGMFKRLATSAATLGASLEALEASRIRLSLAHEIGDDELEELLRLLAGFTLFVRQATKKDQSSDTDEQVAPWDRPTIHSVAPTATPAAGPDSPPEAAEPSPSTTDAEPVPDPEPVETWGVEGALVVGDELGILEALQNEITSFAESLFGSYEDRRPAVWQAVKTSVWWVHNAQSRKLSTVQQFYDVLEAYMSERDAGASPEELADLLARRDLPALLLELRQVFMALQ